VSFASSRKKLEVLWANPKEQEDFVARWFNDETDRLVRAEQAGYQYVRPDEVAGVGQGEIGDGNTDLGSRVSRIVGRTESREPIRATLMKINKRFYQEDLDAKEARNALVDSSIRSGNAGGADIENAYGEVELSRR